MYCDYGEVSCNVIGNSYSSVLTVHVVSAGMMISGCLKAGELRILGTREGVLLNSGDSFIIIIIPASSDHDPVLKFYGTSIAENENDNNQYKYSSLRYSKLETSGAGCEGGNVGGNQL